MHAIHANSQAVISGTDASQLIRVPATVLAPIGEQVLAAVSIHIYVNTCMACTYKFTYLNQLTTHSTCICVPYIGILTHVRSGHRESS